VPRSRSFPVPPSAGTGAIMLPVRCIIGPAEVIVAVMTEPVAAVPEKRVTAPLTEVIIPERVRSEGRPCIPVKGMRVKTGIWVVVSETRINGIPVKVIIVTVVASRPARTSGQQKGQCQRDKPSAGRCRGPLRHIKPSGDIFNCFTRGELHFTLPCATFPLRQGKNLTAVSYPVRSNIVISQ
jgi:hypothetical protein